MIRIMRGPVLAERGQGLMEYALIIMLVAIVVIAILFLLGPAIYNLYVTAVNAI